MSIDEDAIYVPPEFKDGGEPEVDVFTVLGGLLLALGVLVLMASLLFG